MKSAVPKVLHRVGGKPMLKYMLDLLHQLGINRCIAVVGHKAEKVKKVIRLNKVRIVRQPKLLGSADAVWQTKNFFSNLNENVLVIYGDTPLISFKALKS